MATASEMRALLATSCPWCSASPGEKCRVRRGKQFVPVTTLDGESHDARWQAALGRGAKVLGEADILKSQRVQALAASGRPRVERPW